MSRWTSRRHRPSAAARHRLSDAIRRNRAELEVQVAEGLLRSEFYLEVGQAAAAAEVLEEQRLRVAAFEGRVREAIAAAAAESEAEAVLAGAAGVDVLHDEPAAARLPNLVAAALAAVASLAVLTALGAGSGQAGTLASVEIGATDELAAALDVAAPVAPDALRFRNYGSALATGFPATAAPAETDAPAWLAEHDSMFERLGLHVRVRTQVLRELKGLVATLVPGTPLTDEMWLQVWTNAVAAAAEDAPDDGAGPVADGPPDGTTEGTTEGTAEGSSDGDAAESDPEAERESRRSWLSRDGADADADDDETAEDGPGTPDAPSPRGDDAEDADASGDGSEGGSGAAQPPSETPDGAPGTGTDGALGGS